MTTKRAGRQTIKYVVFGPPGCGKTEYLAKRVLPNAIRRHGADRIVIICFTRSAAYEITSRCNIVLEELGFDERVPRENSNTLHSFGFRSLNRPPLAQSKENLAKWNALYPGRPKRQITGNEIDPDEPELEDQKLGAEGDQIFARIQVYRARMVPEPLWDDEAQGFWLDWCAFKTEIGAIDYTDMISIPLESVDSAPGDPAVLIVDEAQDFTRLELALIEKWGLQCAYIVLAGDDDQCQPAGTQVLTTTGYVPIEELDPEVHRLVSYDRASSEVTGMRSGYAFSKADRVFSRKLVTVEAGERSTVCTPDHEWLVRWTPAARAAHVVYLMQSGDRFRIGWCKLLNDGGAFHLGVRSRLEGASAAWVLYVAKDRTEASVMESVIAARFGIPTITFKPVAGATHLTQDAIDRVFSELSGDGLSGRAAQCLAQHNLEIGRPLWTPKIAKASRGGASLFVTAAANLLPGLMAVPVHQQGKRVTWKPVDTEIASEPSLTTVYSLNVERHHLYIADGMVTHNCIYRFKGATPDSFLVPPVPEANKRWLRESFRVPRAVVEFSQEWVGHVGHREPKEYVPRRENPNDPHSAIVEGEVRRLAGPMTTWREPNGILDDMRQYLDLGWSVMLIGSCSFMLDEFQKLLKREGLPFDNPWRRRRGDWNPLFASRGVSSAQKLLAFLRPHGDVWGKDNRMWTPDDLRWWTDVLEAKSVLKHGGKKALETVEGSMPIDDLQRLEEWLLPSAIDAGWNADLDWFEANLLPSRAKAMAYPLLVARRHGPQALLQEPQIKIGTIHSVKGGQAKVVYLLPDLSQAAAREWTTPGEPQDSVRRMFYVGMTRALETLVLCPAAPGFSVRF